MQLEIRPEAEEDLAAAFRWYEEQLPGLGRDLIEAADTAFQRLLDNPAQAAMIQIVRQIGMVPGEIPDNLIRAAGQLELYFNRPRAIANCVQEWREAWARVLYPAFGIPDPVTT